MSNDGPPYGQPGFDLYADQRGRIIGANVAIIIITTFTVALRLLSRRLSRAGFWVDDTLTVIALVFSLAMCGLMLWQINYGFGRHIYIFGPTEAPLMARKWLRIFWVFEWTFHLATTISKYAILAFYYRIFPVPGFRRLLWWVAGLCTLYMIAIVLTVIFQCNPIHYAWDRVLPNEKGTCIEADNFFVASGSINATLNFIVFILPIPLLWRLRTTARQQLILTFVFTLAGFVVIVSIIWVVVLSKLEQSDITWNYVNTGIWSSLEPNMAVVCACIPSLRPLFSLLTGSLSGAPIIRSLENSTSTSGSRSRSFFSRTGRQSASGYGERPFSHLEEEGGLDDLRPLGHDARVSGYHRREGDGKGGYAEEDGLGAKPSKGIMVQTEVKVVSSERLYYNDRLF